MCQYNITSSLLFFSLVSLWNLSLSFRSHWNSESHRDEKLFCRRQLKPKTTLPTVAVDLLNYCIQSQSRQILVVLVGIPGSGKSTFAARISKESGHSSFFRWLVTCQDVLGSRKKVLNAARTHLVANGSVIIDRCNFNSEQRQTWIALANEFCVPKICIVMPNCEDVAACSQRAYFRGDDGAHEDGVDWFGVCSRMAKDFSFPSTEEGFHCVYQLKSWDDNAIASILTTQKL